MAKQYPIAETWDELLQKTGSVQVKYAGHVNYEGTYYPSYVKQSCDDLEESRVIFVGDK